MAKLAVTMMDPEIASAEFYGKGSFMDCDLCRQIAPQSFGPMYIGAISANYVYRQSCAPMEVRACRDALEAWPVEAIGYKLF